MEGMGLVQTSSPTSSHDGLALFVPGFYRAAEQAALHFAGDQRQLAVAADKGTGKVRPARDIAPPDVWTPSA
jgi:hypothetical protein